MNGGVPGSSQFVQLESVSNFTTGVSSSVNFIGVNVRADAPFSGTDAQYLADTDALTWRYPGGTIGEDNNYTSGTIPTTGLPLANNLSNFVTLCVAVGCHAILQLPAEINDPTIDGYDVWYIEHWLNYTVDSTPAQGFTPWLWEIGDEPALWGNFSLRWSLWGSAASKNATPVQFAMDAARIVPAIHHWDPITPIDAIGGSGANATDDSAWVRAVMRYVGANASYVSVHSYLEGNAAPPNNDTAFYTPLYAAKNNFGTYLPKMHTAIRTGCPNCTATGLLLSEDGASNGLLKNSAYESSFPMAMWDAVEAVQAARGNVSSIDYFAYENGYPGSWVNTSTHLEVLSPDYYLFKDITPYLGSTPLNLTFNGTDGGKLQVGGWWGANDTWSLLLVNLDTVNSMVVNLTGTGVLPVHGDIEYSDWNGSTTEPVGGELAWVNATTVAPNSMELLTISPSTTLAPPSTPRGLFVTNYNGTQARVSFVQPAGSVSNDTLLYGVPTATAPYCSVDGNVSAGGATAGILVTDLYRFSDHCFGIQAWNSAGASPVSAFVNVTALNQFPAAPIGLTIVGNTTTSVALNWTNPGGGGLLNDTIYVYRTDACVFWEPVSLNGAFNAWTVSSLTPNTNYCFSVQAWNQTGGSPLSSPAYARTPTVPMAPSNVSDSNLTGTSLVLTWTNPGGGGLLNATVFRWIGTGCRSSENVTSLGSPNETYSVSGLVAGTMYCFEVQAWNATGGSLRSAPLTVFTPTIPGSPTGLIVSQVGTTSLRLGWTDPPGGGLVNLTIWLGIGNCAFTDSTSVGSGATEWSFVHLAPATEYCFAVQAWNLTGASALSAPDLTATLAPPVANVTVLAATNESLTWVWTNPSGSILGDEFYWSPTSCLSTERVDLGGVKSTYTLDGLAPGSEYCAYVEAATLGGLSNSSLPSNGWTLLNAPSGLAVRSATPYAITWNWTNPTGIPSGIDFSWEMGLSCSNPQTTLLSGVPDAYTLDNLTPGAQYCAFVRAVDPSGASTGSPTTEGSTLTIPTAPIGLDATAESSGAVTLSWSPPQGGAVTNFTVAHGTVCDVWTARDSTHGPTSVWTVPGLDPGTTYCFAVESWNGTVASAWSPPVYATTTEPSGVPAAPSSLEIVATSNSSVSLAWINPQTVGLSNDTVLYSPGCGASLSGFSTDGLVNVTTVPGLFPGTPYCFEVEVWSSRGASTPTPVVRSQTTGAPLAPWGLTVTDVGRTYATLAWSDPPATVNVTLYESAHGCAAEGAAQRSLPPGAVRANLTPLAPGTAYCVGVQDRTASGQSSIDFLTFTTSPAAPSVPANSAPPIPPSAAIAIGLAAGLGAAGLLALAFRPSRNRKANG